MSAVPINDNERPLTLNGFSAMRAIPSLDTVELRMVIAAACGSLSEKMGTVHTARIMTHILREMHKAGETLGLAEIALQVAAVHGVTVEELRRPYGEPGAHENRLTHPRQECFWLARAQRKADGSWRHSSTQIGRYFGGRDHATVLHGVRAHARRLLQEPIQ